MTKPHRKEITELLLQERLGLNENWEDFLPQEFPPELLKQLGPADLPGFQRELNKLIDAGCRKHVLWLCLEPLGPALAPRRLMTREDSKALCNACRKAQAQILRYLDEISLAAEALKKEYPVPEVLAEPADETCPRLDALSALQLARDYLFWIQKLTQAWETPEERKVMTNKGPLYLGVYVQCVAPGGSKRRHCEHVVETILGYFSTASPSIRKSVTNFRDRYPQTYRSLYSKLKGLHLSLQ